MKIKRERDSIKDLNEINELEIEKQDKSIEKNKLIRNDFM